ncbi:MAG: hypothetical protein P4M10_01480 [Verrucomicrobiae bacterium]|nr:hypothetical protein [Verrucomicrobiae bacterium]
MEQIERLQKSLMNFKVLRPRFRRRWRQAIWFGNRASSAQRALPEFVQPKKCARRKSMPRRASNANFEHRKGNPLEWPLLFE